jgi:cytochrome c556
MSLASAAEKNDAVKAAYRALGKTCGGCHKQFRLKKKR